LAQTVSVQCAARAESSSRPSGQRPTTVATGWTEGDALWLYVVGAPGSGKTELVRAFADGRKRAYFLSSLTPNSLVSGLKDGKHLLPELDGKTLIIKDFTMTLESHRENRDALFGALRDAYDGSYSKAFGSVGTVGFDQIFPVLAEQAGVHTVIVEARVVEITEH